MCRSQCFTPDYWSLPKGPTGLPSIHGIPMSEEEYRVSGWHSRGSYPTSLGTTEHQWIAPLGGLIEWSRIDRQRREQRIAAAMARREADDAYSDSVVDMVERRR